MECPARSTTRTLTATRNMSLFTSRLPQSQGDNSLPAVFTLAITNGHLDVTRPPALIDYTRMPNAIHVALATSMHPTTWFHIITYLKFTCSTNTPHHLPQTLHPLDAAARPHPTRLNHLATFAAAYAFFVANAPIQKGILIRVDAA